MKIRIYQVDMDRDVNRVAFANLEHLERYQGSSEIDSSIYNRVYEGDVECNDLEEVYQMFNLNHPKDYLGRSLSVSDIVEIIEAPKIIGVVRIPSVGTQRFTDEAEYTALQAELRAQGTVFEAYDYADGDGPAREPGFYFCDSVGFEKVSFQPELAGKMEREVIRIVLVEPGKEARITEISAEFRAQQRIVGGHLHTFEPFNDGTCIVYNEEGLLNGLPMNRVIRDEEKVEEMSYREMRDKFRSAEKEMSGRHLGGYIVFTADSFTKPYSEESRTYFVSSDNKAFQPNMGGYSIFASAIDGSDPLVRLEAYMAAEKGGKDGWKVERCYMKEPGEVREVISGPFFICGTKDEQFVSLTDEQAKKYQEKFKLPEHIRMEGDHIEATPYKPKEKALER